MNDIEITVLDPLEPAQVDGALETIELSGAEDVPDFPPDSRAAFIVQLTRRSQWHRKVHHIATVDGVVAGYANLDMRLSDNRHLAEIELAVRPDHRRRGVGSALLAELERVARADDRSVLVVYIADTIEGRPRLPQSGQGFAKRHGFEVKSQEIRRTADLAAQDESALDALLAASWARADGYELVQWLGDIPEELLAPLAYLDSRLVTDSPMGDLSYEAASADPQRLRERNFDATVKGMLRVSSVMLHRQTGAVAGWTELVAHAGDEENAWQSITIVDPDHRGHRLGTVLKIENHRLLTRNRPRMRYVTTFNAEANDHMININDAVGYRACERWLACEKNLTAGHAGQET